jgi:hypothetical protein
LWIARGYVAASRSHMSFIVSSVRGCGFYYGWTGEQGHDSRRFATIRLQRERDLRE